VLIGGIVLGLVLGLLAGGTLGNLASIRLRHTWLLVIAVLVRYATEALLNAHIPIVEALRLPLLTSSFAVLLAALWINRSYPGLNLAFVGILSNATVIVVNGGYMPIWEPSLLVAGFEPADVTNAIHTILPATLDASFLLHLGPFSDVIPIPLPFIQNVASVGDLFLTAGLAFFLFASVVRMPQELTQEQLDQIRQRLALETGLTPAIGGSATLDRPLMLGSAGQRFASPSAGPFAADSRWTLEPEADGGSVVEAAWPIAGSITRPIQRPRPVGVTLVRQHPYVRLALNSSFSALWTGQLISLFGDRLHIFALVTLVFGITQSVVATGLVYLFSSLPNLLLSPIAGTFVDRWNHKEVMIVSDILRAGLVLLLPLVAMVNIVFIYPMLFAITTISIFFRPARAAILPQVVEPRDLLTANSALWVGETLADVVGIPLAVAFIVALGDAVPLAFWVDSATYLVSATLLTTLAVRAISPGRKADEAAGKPGFFGELVVGWRFLRSEPALLANTIQATIGQFTIGIVTALTAAYAIEVFSDSEFGWQPVLAFIETGIGVGSLAGGFVIGLIGARFSKGRMVNIGYFVWGLMVTILAVTDHLGVAIGVSLGQGVANMVFIIPTQTMFQERTPQALMGRVISFRSALVFGSITLGLGAGSILAGFIGVVPVIAFFGLVTMFAGVAGWFVPALRDA
jgi:MFS transporter, DHA3 family, macrolide efflux protein